MEPMATIKPILRFLSISKEYPELEEPHKDDAVQRRRSRWIFMVKQMDIYGADYIPLRVFSTLQGAHQAPSFQKQEEFGDVWPLFPPSP